MALQKTYTTPSGVDGNYWRITKASLEKGDFSAMNVIICLFKDSVTAGDGSSELMIQEYSWNTESPDEFTGSFDAATLDVVSQNPQERIYAKLKTLTAPIDFTVDTTDV